MDTKSTPVGGCPSVRSCCCVCACPTATVYANGRHEAHTDNAAQPRDKHTHQAQLDLELLIYTDARRGMLWGTSDAIVRVRVPLGVHLASWASGICTRARRCGGGCPWPVLELITPRHCRTPTQGLESAPSLFQPLFSYPCLSWRVEHTRRWQIWDWAWPKTRVSGSEVYFFSHECPLDLGSFRRSFFVSVACFATLL